MKNAGEVARMAEAQTEKMDRKVLWASLYAEARAEQGGAPVKLQFDYVVTDRVQRLLDDATAFLNELPNKPAATPRIRDGGVDDHIAREVLASRGLTSPVGVVMAQPLSAYRE
ncbi:MAG: hypothetical protein H0V22_06940 [Solirubrobacterales bacterium]|nr:hypothetical protein [Solirubrobacterales bacterium]